MAGDRSRVLAGAQVVGIVGIIVSGLLAIGILFASGWITDQVDEVFSSVDGVVETGSTVVNVASGRLQERAVDLDAFVAAAAAAAGSATIPPELAARATSIADRYQEIRDGYVAVRARLESAFETMAQISRFAPGLGLPTEPPAELAALDERIVEIDRNVTRLRADVGGTVDQLVQTVTTMRSAADRVADVTDRVQARIDDVQARLDRANETLDGYVRIVTIVLLLLVAYIAALNLFIVLLARRARSSS